MEGVNSSISRKNNGKDKDYVNIVREKFISMLFPRRCPVCGDIVDPFPPLKEGRRLICEECIPKLHFVKEPVCKCCGREILDEDGELCGNCQRRSFSFEYNIALLNYNEVCASSMGQIKYKGKREFLDYYGAESVKKAGNKIREMGVQALVPVPVHPKRLRIRGYNQSEVLARIIGEELSIPVLPSLLVREKNTTALKELGAKDRRRSLAEAFRAGRIPANLNTVCLIDDIFTTGSTIECCCKALQEAGVKNVYSFVLCIRAEK